MGPTFGGAALDKKNIVKQEQEKTIETNIQKNHSANLTREVEKSVPAAAQQVYLNPKNGFENKNKIDHSILFNTYEQHVALVKELVPLNEPMQKDLIALYHNSEIERESNAARAVSYALKGDVPHTKEYMAKLTPKQQSQVMKETFEVARELRIDLAKIAQTFRNAGMEASAITNAAHAAGFDVLSLMSDVAKDAFFTGSLQISLALGTPTLVNKSDDKQESSGETEVGTVSAASKEKGEEEDEESPTSRKSILKSVIKKTAKPPKVSG